MQKEKQISLILDVITFIEQNINEPLSVQDVCNQTPYSSWQFQRLFRAFAKDSIGSYIRGRRLTIAAIELMSNSHRRVLDVAIEAQFSSQEAFSRAFKEYFEVSPSEIKNQPGIIRVKKKPRLTPEYIRHIQYGNVNDPQIITTDVQHFMGLVTTISSPLGSQKNYINSAVQIWSEFNLRRREIEDRKRGLSYGIALSEEGDMMDEKMLYFAGVQTSSIDSSKKDMQSVTLPAQQIAMFEKVGHEKVSHFTIDYIYGLWLPNSGYKRGQGFDYEIFGPEFRIDNQSALSTYCIPVIKDV